MLIPVAIAIIVGQSASVSCLKRLSADAPNRHYPSQRGPLQPSPLQKLPAGAIKAQGWLLTELKLQAQGFSGRLEEISQFLDHDNNAWLGTGDASKAGWEELPYWLRGQVSLAYVTGDPKLIADVKRWIEPVLQSQKPDGWFGPEANRNTKLGTPDLWPNMLMLRALQTYYEATNDRRVIDLMSRYCGYLLSIPQDQFLDEKHYWHYYRAGDQLATLIWLYGRTRDSKILTLAKRLHKSSARWDEGVANVHGVNFAQGFREPATFSVFSGSRSDLAASEKDLFAFRDEYGQAPGGLYAADENARKGFTDPRQAAESCAVVEMMLSHELLFNLTGDPAWADRAEDVAFNWMPVTMTADLKALRYLQSANMAISDALPKSPGVQNGGPMFLMDPNDHRCCQHNVGIGWPYLAEHLWFGTSGDGLLAGIYAPSTVTALVGSGIRTTIVETTDYPFGETIKFTISPAKPAKFPLSLRIPGWCTGATVAVNGKASGVRFLPGSFARVHRTWKQGDVITLRLPMKVVTESWSQRPGTLSVVRGPLAYSLRIQEQISRVSRPNHWDAFEIRPASEWNFGLGANPSFTVRTTALKSGVQAWDLKNVPISIETMGKAIPEWQLDRYGLVSPIQACPAFTAQPAQKVTLVPMGAARLRVSVFPTVTSRPTGNVWKTPVKGKKPLPTTYSFRCWFDNDAALSDGLLPESSHDESIPRFTWWDHKGTDEWVQYDLPTAKTFSSCRVYWFDDGATGGGCRIPASWKLQVKEGDYWRDLDASEYQVVLDGWSVANFSPTTASVVRLLVKLQPEFSSGILEWELK